MQFVEEDTESRNMKIHSGPGRYPKKILTNPDFPNLKGRIHGHHVGIHNRGSKECQNVAQEQICAVAGEKCSYVGLRK